MAGQQLIKNAWRGGTKCFSRIRFGTWRNGQRRTGRVWNTLDLPLADDAIPESAKHSPEGCTTLLYSAAKSSVALIAHNEDGPPELDGHCCWLSVRQENGSKFSTYHYPGMLQGHTFSVNSHGLVQTIN